MALPRAGQAEESRLNLLVAQRDASSLNQLARDFQAEGMLVTKSTTGEGVREAVGRNDFDAIILGFQFDDMTAVQLCRALRRAGAGTPIIILSVVRDTDDTVEVLDAGADDFLHKPMEFRELLAHVRAMVRRCRGDDDHCLRYADLELDLANRGVRRGERAIVLTPREFALLELLMRNRNRIVNRVTIGDRVWGEEYRDDASNVVDVYVSRLRRKIDRPFDKPLIHTAPGAGYILSDEVIR